MNVVLKTQYQFIRQKMQIKRSPITITHHNKQNNLIQPLIGISKASTPVRTRVIGANSTPINPNKINNFHKSPNNKENHQSNHIKLEGCIKTYATPQVDSRINLSPIMAINKKMSEGIKIQPKKSLTPQGPKVIQEYQNYGFKNSNPNEKNYKTLNQSKASGFNSTTNFSNLRNSNSFKNLIEARCKTPNRFQNNPITIVDSKRQQIPLKQSQNSNQLFKQFTKQNKLKLTQSRSYDRFKPIATVSSMQGEIKCMNNDGKKAKYRVVNEDNDENQIQLYYCSKCTIPLVQQGFIVQQLGKQFPKEQERGNCRGEYRNKLQSKKNSLEFILKDMNQRQQQSMGELNKYYNTIMQYIQGLRRQDKRNVQQYYLQKRNPAAKCLQQINHVLESTQKVNNTDIEKILSVNDQELIAESLLDINSEELIHNFQENHAQNIKIIIEPSFKNSLSKVPQPLSSRNHAMRFSFEKLLSDIHHKKSNIKSIMNPLQQEDEEEGENQFQMIKEGHNAFRDLFPQVEEAEHISNGIHSPTFKSF